MRILLEFFSFLKARKRLWLFPLMAIIVLLSVLLILIQNSALATFIYSLF